MTMPRMTDQALDEICENLNTATENHFDFTISHSCGSVILVNGESREISPPLTKGGLAEWMYAFKAGLIHATRPGYLGGDVTRKQIGLTLKRQITRKINALVNEDSRR